VTDIRIVGIRGSFTFEEAVEHFSTFEADIALLDPSIVCGSDHIRSAVMHAEKSFAEGRNRAKKLLTEVILYVACERQIKKALDLARPVSGDAGMVAVVLGGKEDLKLTELGAVEDPSLVEPSAEKAEKLGVTMFEGIPPEDAVLEQVASVDLMKQ